MNGTAETVKNGQTTPSWLRPLAGWCALTSAFVSVFGIAFLLIFFVGQVGPAGTLNDIAVIIQYALMLPMAAALYQLLRPVDPDRSRLALLVGLVGIPAVILFQLLLVLDLLAFGIYIIAVSIAFFVALAWFVLNRNVDLGKDLLPDSLLLTILAGLYIGYPIWTYRVGRNLLTG